MPIPGQQKADCRQRRFRLTLPGIHRDGVLKNRENYGTMTPESIGSNQIQLNLTSRSGRAAVNIAGRDGLQGHRLQHGPPA